MEALLLEHYETGTSSEGADAYPALMLLKALLLQNWFRMPSDPLPLLRDPCSRKGRLPADPLPTHFEVGSVIDQISDLLGDGPVQPLDQLLLDALVHHAHLRRARIAAPKQVGDFSCLASGHPSEKHRRDDRVDPLILSPVACQNIAVTRSRRSASGQTQPLNEAKAGFQFPYPSCVSVILAQRRSLIRLGTDEPEELVLRVSLQHLSHEIPDPRLNVVQKVRDTFEATCAFIQATRASGLINDCFSC